MLTDRKLRLVIASFFINGIIFCQDNANYIYSRFGIGDIVQGGFAQNKALGGLAICTRQVNQINYSNPASYNSLDSMSFVWDIGLLIDFNKASDINGSSAKRNVYLDHLAMSFPVSKWNFISVGVVPLSVVEYRYFNQQQQEHQILNNSFSGTGKINRFYLGQAYGLFDKHLNFGFNVSYFFGFLDRKESFEYFDRDNNIPSYFNLNSCNDENNNINGFGLNIGVQGIEELSKGILLTGGLTVEPKSKLKFKYINSYKRYVGQINNLIGPAINKDTSVNYMMPFRIGIGTGIQIKDKLLMGIDYVRQDWSKVNFLHQNATFKKNEKLSVGIQYSPNCWTSRNYFKKIFYRMGGYVNYTYLIYNNIPIRDYVISFGAGLPFTNSGTMFNFAVEVGSHGEKSDGLARINYTRISLGLTLYDFRFIKKN